MALFEQIQESLERQLEIRQSTAVGKAELRIKDEAAEICATRWEDAFGGKMRQRDFLSTRNFAGSLPLQELIGAVDRTASKFGGYNPGDAFRYFCAICWAKIRERAPRGPGE